MATEVLLPQWGMNMEDGLMVKWLVQEGDTVQAGQPLVEIETAKINVVDVLLRSNPFPKILFASSGFFMAK